MGWSSFISLDPTSSAIIPQHPKTPHQAMQVMETPGADEETRPYRRKETNHLLIWCIISHRMPILTYPPVASAWRPCNSLRYKHLLTRQWMIDNSILMFQKIRSLISDRVVSDRCVRRSTGRRCCPTGRTCCTCCRRRVWSEARAPARPSTSTRSTSRWAWPYKRRFD